FFVTDNPAFGTLYAFATFALAFFIRPLGGVIFSHIGDKIGRKKTLVLTLSLMGSATFLMGVLPTYESIGIWAPIFIILLRTYSRFRFRRRMGWCTSSSCRVRS